MGGLSSTDGRDWKMHTKFCSETQMRIVHLVNRGVGGSTIAEVLKK